MCFLVSGFFSEKPELLTEKTFLGITGYMTHHVVIQATSKSGRTKLDPEDLCVVGVHCKDQGAGFFCSSREWRTSPILLFVEHNGKKYAYTCNGSLYELGEQIDLSEMLKMVPSTGKYFQ